MVHCHHVYISWPVCAGSFHLIHLMFDDYVLYLLESLHCQERANELMRAMKGEGTTGESKDMGCQLSCLIFKNIFIKKQISMVN